MRTSIRFPDWISRPPAWVVAAALGLLLLSDHLYRMVSGDGVGPAILDETAHLMTGFLVLAALFRGARPGFTAGLLVSSVLIDADHIPGALGYVFLTRGTSRPYGHSLLTLIALAVLAILWRRRRDLWLGALVGIAFHFARDMAERDWSGVALLWPFSDHTFTSSHVVYLGWIGALALIAAVRALWPATLRLRTSRVAA